jgi:ribosome-binding protein aMBF1 (putative translation factor)
MTLQRRRTSDAVEIIHRRYYSGRPNRLAGLDEARSSASVSRRIHELRARAGLSQNQLARLVRTTPSVISRLENDEYRGHSLSMLRRIAAALNACVDVRFLPLAGNRRRRRESMDAG